MIVVKIEIHPGGSEENKHLEGMILVANDGTGDSHLGNYNYAITHTGVHKREKDIVYKSGKIMKFERRRGVYALLRRILTDAQV